MSSPLKGNTANRDALIEAGAKYLITKNPGGTIGPAMMGHVSDFIMFGLVLHQFITWLGGAKRERTFIKVVTVWVCLVATAATVYGIWLLWHVYVLGFGTYSNFTRLDLLAWYGLLTVLVTFPVQTFYLERAYRIMHNQLWVLLLVFPMCLTSFAGGIAAVFAGLRATSVLDVSFTPFFVWFGSTMAADLLLTGIIIFGLLQSRTGWSGTDHLVSRLIRSSIESQLLCTLVATAMLISYVVLHPSLINVFWTINHGKFYVVSYMGVLNYRDSLRHQDESTRGSSLSKPNTFGNSSHRHQQETIDLGLIQVEDKVYQQNDTVAQSMVHLRRISSFPGSDIRDHPFYAENNASRSSNQLPVTQFV